MYIDPWRLVFYGVAISFSVLLSVLTTYEHIDFEIRKEIQASIDPPIVPPTVPIAPPPVPLPTLSPTRKPTESPTASPIAPKVEPAKVESRSLSNPAAKQKVKPVIAPWTKLIKSNGHTYPRSFVFSEITRLDDYGLKVRMFDEKQRQAIQSKMEQRLCARSNKYAPSVYEAKKCTHRVEFLKCTSCSEVDGTWYTASSATGAVFGTVDAESNIRYPYYNDGPFMYQQLDIAVPIAGQDSKLRAFAMHLGSSVKKFREGMQGNHIAIRLLITRFANEAFPSEAAMTNFTNVLTKSAELERPGDSVEFVTVDEVTFNRAKAVNALHAVACHHDDCVLACMDVDMSITSQFLRNAMIFPFPGAAAYFPIMWSEFNPETVHLVDNFLTASAKWKFTDHHGYWRKSSYGMYVIAGADAKYLTMNEKFVGWGGEDNDFYARVGETLNIIRIREKGLTHIWHAKDCKLGSFVENDFFKSCIGAKASTEGSPMGLFLRSLRDSDPATFNKYMEVKSTKVETVSHAVLETVDDTDVEKVNVLIAVVTSRKNLKSRAATIMKTWAEPRLVPENIAIKFFVGTEAIGDSFSGTEADIENLAREAGIRDLSSMRVMTNVLDDEYPPVRKNSAMLKHLDDIVASYENDPTTPSTFQWIFKVDDDAYVNLNGLLRFVKYRNPVGYHVYGERGFGRKEDREGLEKGGMVKPYCTGGPGYILSRQTLKRVALGMEECVQSADVSPYRQYLWHSDVVIGFCIQKQTEAGCWSDDDYDKKRIFLHNHKGDDPFVPDKRLEWVVSVHPFKDPAVMERHHQRYLALNASKTKTVAVA